MSLLKNRQAIGVCETAMRLNPYSFPNFVNVSLLIGGECILPDATKNLVAFPQVKNDCLEITPFDLKFVLKSTQLISIDICCIDEFLELVFVHDVNITTTISLHYHINIIQPHCNSAIIAIILTNLFYFDGL